MKTIIVNVQIQLDQFSDSDTEIYVMDQLNIFNTILTSQNLDSQPQIFANNIDSSDINVHNVND